jgi:aminodeoxyfutalosine deaminase
LPIDFTTLPKTELHAHLEGSIPVEALFELVKKHKRLDEAPTLEHVRRRYEFDDFAHFLDVYKWTVSLLKHADDYDFVAYEAARKLAEQNVLYAEIMIGLGAAVRFGGHKPAEIVRAAWRGFQRAMGDFGMVIRAQVATSRDHGVQFAMDRLRDIEPVIGDVDICAFNIGGNEHLYPLPDYTGVFQRAKAMGLKICIHAGEVSGPKDVWDALAMEPDRIGHGIRSVQDAALLAELKRRDMPLEICPMSNEATGAVERLADHPLPQLIAAGVPLVLSSDDPAMFHTSVTREYQIAHDVLGVDVPTLVGIAREGFRRGFMDDAQRKDLLQRFETEARQWCSERGIAFPA